VGSFTNQHVVSLGMFVCAGMVLAYRLGKWYAAGTKGNRNYKELAPLGGGIALTIAMSACTSGVIGFVIHFFGGAESQIGNAALTGGTGVHTVTAKTAVGFGELNQFGAALLLLTLAFGFGMWKHKKKDLKMDLRDGAWIGIGLGPLIGGYTLIPVINKLGDSTIGHFFFHTAA
jgi:hypothetical protein